ncbi:hypothetical protein C1645_818885 [Glomus cerebriforme]|uniref:Protein kinase domain-containing protein n=1 Tax=Glomus cerebriforme TaxID=658196 RepID=A0A397TG02_9GLOM|nr:hypothetical protein C1645_818885 [Glomus cerebriforme]
MFSSLFLVESKVDQTYGITSIYGVISYIAPEIFKGSKGSAFSKESDIYSMGMIMWELTTMSNMTIIKILNGVRPEITEDTP